MKVTLFPFLSVLLCMMGAMIMLLVVAAQNVREWTGNPVQETVNQTQTLTAQEAEELSEEINIKAEDADWLAKKLAAAREQAATELAEHQARLALAEKETQKIRDELDRLELLAQQLDGQTSANPEEVAHLKRLLAQQQQRKEEAELELAELQREAAQKEKSYAIVPYRGPNGTFRRPIYIECCHNKIIIQPEGIELFPGDFQALDDMVGNSFDSVLRVIRQYYVETNQIVRGSEPYPLFSVRPSGVEMYENAMQAVHDNARRATGSWITDFGYELINEDWNMQYHPPDDELRKRIAQQLERSRNRQSGYRVAMQMAKNAPGYGSNAPSASPPQYSVDHRGNVRPVGGQLSGEDLQRQLAAHRPEAAPQGEAGGRETHQASVSAEMIDKEERQIRQMEQQIRQQAGQPPLLSPQQTQQPLPPQVQHLQQQHMQQPPEQQEMHITASARGIPQAQRPQNWGLKGETRFTSGLSRTVRIRCEADKFVLPAQVGLRLGRTISITDSVSSAADELVQAIWEFQESWGSAGTHGFWRPILEVQVSPGGEQRLAELKSHLRNSGLVIEE